MKLASVPNLVPLRVRVRLWSGVLPVMFSNTPVAEDRRSKYRVGYGFLFGLQQGRDAT